VEEAFTPGNRARAFEAEVIVGASLRGRPLKLGYHRFVQKAKNEYVPPIVLANVHALAGDKDLAFSLLEKAIDTHDPQISLIKIQPAYDSVRPDPRFTKMLQRLNLTP
jgi:hypothetical protein